MKNPVLVPLFWILGLIVLMVSVRCFGQDRAEVPATGTIPKAGYKTWSLFLVCNPEWLVPPKASNLGDLYSQFDAFGRSIGDDNLAVWFWKAEKGPKLAQNVDVERSIRFCKLFHLKPSSSPDLVVTSSYPDEANPPKDFAVFELGNMSSSDLTKLLENLTDQLVLQGKVAAESPNNQAPALWVRLLDAAQRAIGSFGCAWTLKVQTGIINADLHSCAGH